MIKRASYLALLGLAVLAAGCDSGGPEAEPVQVTYRVTAFGQYPAATAASVTYEDGDGRRVSAETVALPFERSVQVESGETAFLRATSRSTTGALGLRAEILADGEVVAADQSDGSPLPSSSTSLLELSLTTTVTAAAD